MFLIHNPGQYPEPNSAQLSYVFGASLYLLNFQMPSFFLDLCNSLFIITMLMHDQYSCFAPVMLRPISMH